MRRKLLVLAVLAAGVAGMRGQEGGDEGWRHPGGDPGARRFSALGQITRGNVSRLERAWRFDTGSSNLQGTPVVIDGLMYVTGGPHVFALEPETGRQVWK